MGDLTRKLKIFFENVLLSLTLIQSFKIFEQQLEDDRLKTGPEILGQGSNGAQIPLPFFGRIRCKTSLII